MTETRIAANLQVGIMLNGCVIDNMVIGTSASQFWTCSSPCKGFATSNRGLGGTGGPAYNSGQLERGDLILEVDRTPVTSDNVHEMLLGSDVPGTHFTMKVKKESRAGVKEVQLTRMATEVIADRRRMFELFTKMKVRNAFRLFPPTRFFTVRAELVLANHRAALEHAD